MASARAALGEEDGEAASSIALLAFLYGGQSVVAHRSQLDLNKRDLGCAISEISFYGHNAGEQHSVSVTLRRTRPVTARPAPALASPPR
jgi:hypothetical protein